jgi:adenosylhomocysteine nucleosidase
VTRLGVVTGMLAEAQCLAATTNQPTDSEPPLIFSAGGSATRAGEGARQLIRTGATALLSFGIAGALDPGLAPGDLVVPEIVLSPDGTAFRTSEAWRDAMTAAIGDARNGTLLGSDKVVATRIDKQKLFRDTDALAVDMESHGVAAVAAAAEVPFLVVRAVADPARRHVPRAALAALAADGGYRIGAVLARLLVRPWEIPAVVMLARDSAAAMKRLRRVAALDLVAGL